MENELPKGIIKRGDKFRVSVMIDGRRATQTHVTLEQATKALNALRAGKQSAAMSSKVWNLREAVDAFIHHRVTSHRTRIDNLRWQTLNILAHFGPETNLNKIGREEMVKFIDALRDQGYSAGTIHVVKCTLRSLMNFAWDRGHKSERAPIVKSDPIRNGRIRFLSYEEEAAILSHMRTSGWEIYAEAIEFLIDTGCRKNEMHKLEWQDVDLKTGRITFWETKTNTPRTVRMTDRVQSFLRVRKLRGIKQFVFDGVSPNVLYRSWWSTRDALGFAKDRQFVIHALRHTCCTRLLGAGVDIRTVQQWMGHSSLTVTQRYAHFIPQRLDDAVKALNAAHWGAMSGASDGAGVAPSMNQSVN